MRLYAIGDVHGRLDLLTAMHAAIAAEIERDGVADWRIIHLGDYVDRGPDSKGVLDFLVERAAADQRVITLAGNHDVGFLDFLDDAGQRRACSPIGAATRPRAPTASTPISAMPSGWLRQPCRR